MKIYFWSIGKLHEPYVKEGTEIFTKRISHYYSVEWKLIPPVKNAASLSNTDLKKNEADVILNLLLPGDVVILLDEKGKQLTSEQLADMIQLNANKSTKNLVFIIGGAYGIGEKVIKRANFVWSLSNLVFPHQLVRLILAEQVYRACTIIRKEKYHHS
ncbi:MAG: 23S rRNA (pseudouridine(1915)-N(3))-methyltransferase RlmH [Ginsengibacter sp.]